jgi:signal transduction histidine kinase
MKEKTAKQLAFYGRITAGFTHEIKNILAIVKESSGLMEDLLSLSKDAPFPHWDRFSHRVSVIQQQVKRGVDLASRLNRFAHSTDEVMVQIDLNELAEQLVRLSERFARLKDVRLRAQPAPSAASLTTSPVELQMALFTIMESFWTQMPAGSELELKVEGSEHSLCLIIHWAEETEASAELKQKVQSSEAFNTAQQILGDLGGEISDAYRGGFALKFPA